MNETAYKIDPESIRFIADSIEGLAGKKIESIKETVYQQAQTLREQAEYRTGSLTISLTPYISAISWRANYGLIRVTLHASPEIFALIMAMISIYKTVIWVIRIFNVIQIVGTIWRINQMVIALWPRYREWWDGFLTRVSEFSGHLGWGVDGVSHLLNATAAGINILGGLMGKSGQTIKFEMMERAQYTASMFTNIINQLQQDPAKWLSTFFEQSAEVAGYKANQWWMPIAATIEEGISRGEEAFTQAEIAINELQAIQTGMPEAVRNFIPQAIWSGLEQADSLIHDNILPRFTEISNALSFINAIQNASINRLGELATKLGNPGDILLGIDDLPDYAKAPQLGMIDDVTSREFEYWTNSERNEVQADLNDFDRIDTLLKAPTPQPSFLSFEGKPGQTIRGIRAEPQETWFVGGYNSPY